MTDCRPTMRLELKCPACDSDNTQRLSLVHLLRSADTELGARRSPSARLSPPPKPRAITLGLLAGLAVGAAAFELLPRALMLWSLLPGILTWIGITIWLRAAYKQELVVWEDRMDQHFLCWRCGEVFNPSRLSSPKVPPLVRMP